MTETNRLAATHSSVVKLVESEPNTIDEGDISKPLVVTDELDEIDELDERAELDEIDELDERDELNETDELDERDEEAIEELADEVCVVPEPPPPHALKQLIKKVHAKK